MRVTPMHHHIDPVESAFEELPIGLELERIRHDTLGIREHAILGDDSKTFDATRTGHGIPLMGSDPSKPALRRHGLHDHTQKMGPARPSRQPDRVSFGTRWAAWGSCYSDHTYHIDVT